MMLGNRKYCCWLVVMLVCSHTLSAQPARSETSIEPSLWPVSDSLIQVGEITITGNRKTRADIILREIPFKSGEEYTLKEFVKKIEDARRQLMNTALFHNVIVAAKNIEGSKINILVGVKERWYIFPVPYLRPVDRNLNQWIVQQKASLDRVDYGAKLLYNNITGRNDKFRLLLIDGYTKQFSSSYDRLYIDNKLKWGMNIGFAMGKNREVNYNTIGDKQVFLKDRDNYLHSFLSANFELTYRRAIKTRHRFGIGYSTDEVKDTIIKQNPAYYSAGQRSIRFPLVYYNMAYYDLDYIPYPTKGYAFQIDVGKKGFNKSVNVWQLSVKASGSWHLSPKTFINLNTYTGIKLPFNQPYFSQRFLGYNDVFMQGYEYYVVDGVAGGYLKTTLTREFLNFTIRVPPTKKGKEAQHIPVRIFGKMFGNTGYVYNPQPGDNQLTNKWLYSGGIGIDILTFYDVTFKLEWTFNQLGQNGLFLHRKTLF